MLTVEEGRTNPIFGEALSSYTCAPAADKSHVAPGSGGCGQKEIEENL